MLAITLLGLFQQAAELPQREIPAVPPAELPPSFHRHFSPTPSQWLSEAPISFAADGQNLHPYVG